MIPRILYVSVKGAPFEKQGKRRKVEETLHFLSCALSKISDGWYVSLVIVPKL